MDDSKGYFVDSGVDLLKYKKGWHHLAVAYSDNKVSYISFVYSLRSPITSMANKLVTVSHSHAAHLLV